MAKNEDSHISEVECNILKRLDPLMDAEDTIKRFDYHFDMLQDMLVQFAKTDVFSETDIAFKEKNVKEAIRTVHSVKGVALSLGLISISQKAIDLLTLLKAMNEKMSLEDWKRAECLYGEMKKAYQIFCKNMGE